MGTGYCKTDSLFVWGFISNHTQSCGLERTVVLVTTYSHVA